MYKSEQMKKINYFLNSLAYYYGGNTHHTLYFSLQAKKSHKTQSNRHGSSCLLKAWETNSFIKFINVKANSENIFVKAVLLNYEYQ